MEPVTKHSHLPNASFDGGELDCGNGLLLLLRKHLDPLQPGELLEMLSRESSVEEDLPAWCRLTKNELVSFTREGNQRSFLISKGPFVAAAANSPIAPARNESMLNNEPAPQRAPHLISHPSVLSPTLQLVQPKEIAPLSIMGVGSWPRPRWMMHAMHEYLEGRMPESEFQESANDAVRLAVVAQIAAGADVVTDGEQRRDNYASFVGTRLENCQLIPLVDLLPLVDNPDDFANKLDSLDVPADKVRHPAVFGKIKRKQTLAAHEVIFLQQLTDKPIKVALPGPYLLSRIMWMDCITNNTYSSREDLSRDIVDILREEIADLLALGTSLIQLDEPVLTEVVYTKPNTNDRIFMCGALSERLQPEAELSFARNLINAVVDGFPPSRLAVHVCRGNWTPDESAALSGDYGPLLPVLCGINVGTLFLEYCTPRAGDLSLLSKLPAHMRVGLGVVNPKDPHVETVEEITKKVQNAGKYIDMQRLFLNPDCGFATFADNPVATTEIATGKLKVMAEASKKLRHA